jgi:hypothetical protein
MKWVVQGGYQSHICCTMINFDIDQDPNYFEVAMDHKNVNRKNYTVVYWLRVFLKNNNKLRFDPVCAT